MERANHLRFKEYVRFGCIDRTRKIYTVNLYSLKRNIFTLAAQFGSIGTRAYTDMYSTLADHIETSLIKIISKFVVNQRRFPSLLDSDR